jgi:hypothetical protein
VRTATTVYPDELLDTAELTALLAAPADSRDVAI